MATRRRSPAEVQADASAGHPLSGRRRTGILLLGVGLAWLSLAVGIDNTVGRRAPDFAAQWGAGSATIAGIRAEQLATPGATNQQLVVAQRLGRGALAREPVNMPAIRALAQVAALRNNMPAANRLFAYAEHLSRRDLATQIWQVEAQVQAGDVNGALRHYDRALRTTARARALLFPILVSAASTPDVAQPLGRILASRPNWGLDFIAVAASDQQILPDSLATLLTEARLRASNPAERAPLATGLTRLAAASRYREAYALYKQATQTAAPDYGFDRDPVLPPFDWSFAEEADLSASRETRGQGTALALQAPNGRAGEFGRRLLVLAPGTYRLAFTASGAGTDPIARAAVSIQCVEGALLVRLPITGVEPTPSVGNFIVPVANCPAQQLLIAAPAGLMGNEPVMLEDFSISRTGQTSTKAKQQRGAQ